MPPSTLEEIWRDSWSTLVRGASSAKHPYHWPVLGNVTPEGACSLRTVVLRAAKPGSRQLICYSDRRAGKVKEIEAHGRVSWHFFDRKHQQQLRCSGDAIIHLRGALFDEHWNRTSGPGRKAYCTLEAPGTTSPEATSGLSPALEAASARSRHDDQARAELETLTQAGQDAFAVIECVVDWMEWLWLGREGHRRARFEWQDETLTSTWLIP